LQQEQPKRLRKIVISSTFEFSIPLVWRNRNGSHESSTVPDENRFEAPMKMVAGPLSTRQREPAVARVIMR